jgi:hypothetical protein
MSFYTTLKLTVVVRLFPYLQALLSAVKSFGV